jgi:filamentous hemagglutinin
VTVTTAQDTLQSSTHYEKHESGLMSGGGLAVTVGSRSLTQQGQSQMVTNNASVIGSSQGNVVIGAGQDVTLTGAQVIAGQDIGIVGRNVTVNAAYDTYDERISQQMKQSGLTVGIGGGLVGLGQAMGSAVKAGTDSGDSRLAAVQGLAAAEMAYQNHGAIKDTTNAIANGANPVAAAGAQLQVSVRHDQSHCTTKRRRSSKLPPEPSATNPNASAGAPARLTQ